MDIIAAIVVGLLILEGVAFFFNDASEKGILYAVLEIVGVIILAALGL